MTLLSRSSRRSLRHVMEGASAIVCGIDRRREKKTSENTSISDLPSDSHDILPESTIVDVSLPCRRGTQLKLVILGSASLFR